MAHGFLAESVVQYKSTNVLLNVSVSLTRVSNINFRVNQISLKVQKIFLILITFAKYNNFKHSMSTHSNSKCSQTAVDSPAISSAVTKDMILFK